MLNKKLTIIIPTYQRHSYLKRILEYYKGSGFHNIIIADSTLEVFKKINSYNFEYFHYPNLSFSNKMIDVFKKVKTPYVVICADDDFILLNGLTKSIEFLDKHTEYVSCCGTFVTFYTEYLNSFNFINLGVNEYKEYSSKSLSGRIDFHFNNYYTLMYSVHKTEIFEAFIKDFKYINQPFLREVGQSFYTLAYGANKVLSTFYGARECMNGKSEGQTHDNLEVVSTEKKYENEYNDFYLKILKILKKHNNESEINIKQIIDKAIVNYKQQCITTKPNSLKLFTKKLFSFFDYLKKKHIYKVKSLKKLKSFTADKDNFDKWTQIENIIKKYK